jgi:hypothetical protein
MRCPSVLCALLIAHAGGKIEALQGPSVQIEIEALTLRGAVLARN